VNFENCGHAHLTRHAYIHVYFNLKLEKKTAAQCNLAEAGVRLEVKISRGQNFLSDPMSKPEQQQLD
jgi:hypothetical protein